MASKGVASKRFSVGGQRSVGGPGRAGGLLSEHVHSGPAGDDEPGVLTETRANSRANAGGPAIVLLREGPLVPVGSACPPGPPAPGFHAAGPRKSLSLAAGQLRTVHGGRGDESTGRLGPQVGRPPMAKLSFTDLKTTVETLAAQASAWPDLDLTMLKAEADQRLGEAVVASEMLEQELRAKERKLEASRAEAVELRATIESQGARETLTLASLSVTQARLALSMSKLESLGVNAVTLEAFEDTTSASVIAAREAKLTALAELIAQSELFVDQALERIGAI